MYSDFTISPSFENKQAIVFCPDNNFVKYFGATLISLIENSSAEKNYDIIILDRDITDENKKRLLKCLPDNFTLRFFNIDEYIKSSFDNISLNADGGHWTISAYYRIFIPFIMHNYEKVLYIDSDTIINRNLDEIFNLDFDNKKIMACHDTFVIKNHLPRDERRIDYIKNTLKVSNIEDYFNSGVLLFNISAINQDEYFNNLMEVFTNVKTFLFVDQEVLNSVFFGQVKFLPFEYNCQLGYQYTIIGYEDSLSEKYKTDFLNAQKNPIIIHYTTHIKPWNYAPKYWQLELMDIYWHYARKTVFYEEIIFSSFANIINYKLNELEKQSKKSNKKKKAKKTVKNAEKYTFLERIFSVKNSYKQGYKRKIITIAGLKIKYRAK
jgi:lipopolysaccharide biosynthesis glycosyltransferase